MAQICENSDVCELVTSSKPYYAVNKDWGRGKKLIRMKAPLDWTGRRVWCDCPHFENQEIDPWELTDANRSHPPKNTCDHIKQAWCTSVYKYPEKLIFIYTQDEMDKYDVQTHYTVKRINKIWSCTCRGFQYHKKCKHIKRAQER